MLKNGRGAGPTPQPLLDRLMNKVLVGDKCWEWAGRHDRDGYARIDVGSRSSPNGWRDTGAHVVVWEMFHGPVPAGSIVHHECGNKGCVRLEHLGVLTRAEHQRLHHRRDTCRRGHALDDPYVDPSTGRWRCRVCAAARARERNARRKAAECAT